jgi:hypothetical protein
VLISLVAGVLASPAFAGPVDTLIPVNPCGLANGSLKLQFVANDTATDSGGAGCPNAGSGCAETLVVCYNAGETGDKPIDVVVELFDNSGALITPAVPATFACNVAPGASTAFRTNFLPPASPYQGAEVSSISPQVPPGSLRILATSKRIACDVSVIDTSGYVVYGLGSPLWVKDVTVTRANKGQKGD